MECDLCLFIKSRDDGNTCSSICGRSLLLARFLYHHTPFLSFPSSPPISLSRIRSIHRELLHSSMKSRSFSLVILFPIIDTDIYIHVNSLKKCCLFISIINDGTINNELRNNYTCLLNLYLWTVQRDFVRCQFVFLKTFH